MCTHRVRMNKLNPRESTMKTNYSVLAAAAGFVLCASPMYSQASVLPTALNVGAGLLDTDTQLLWTIGDLTSSQADGYRLATTADVSTMLANRLKDLTEHGATQVNLRADGSYSLVDTPGNRYDNGSNSLRSTSNLMTAMGSTLRSSSYSLTTLDAEVAFQDGNVSDTRHVVARTALIGKDDGSGMTSVTFEMGEKGIYNQGGSNTNCTSQGCVTQYYGPPNIYWYGRLNSTGVQEAITIGSTTSVLLPQNPGQSTSVFNPSALDPVGYLMVKSAVPETSAGTMMLLGLVGVAGAKLGRRRGEPHAN